MGGAEGLKLEDGRTAETSESLQEQLSAGHWALSGELWSPLQDYSGWKG